MDLILWRHADAEDANGRVPDIDRPLTERGRKQAQRIAEWLRSQHTKNLRVFTSPARRAMQTAEALGVPAKVNKQLAIGASPVELLAAAEWPDHAGVTVLVGHQPALGRLASLLLSGAEADWTIKKGGVWWFTNRVRHDETQTVLRAVLNP